MFLQKNAVFHLLRALKRGEHAGILIDQKLNDRIHVEAPSLAYLRVAPLFLRCFKFDII